MSIDTANGYISQVVLPPKEEGDIERLYLIKDKNAQDNIKLLQSDLTSLDSELNTLDNKIDNIEIPNISNLVSTDDLTNTVSGLISKKETNDNYVTWSSLLTYYPNNATLKNNYAHITDGIIDNATINHENVNGLSENYAHIAQGKIINAVIDYNNVDGLNENYAHITDGIINNATINYTDINDLNDHYASISNGIIDNASIDYTKINNLNDNYAHITNGSIDNATISHQKIEDLDNNYAHIANGIIDNANIDYANVNNLNTNYAHITDGIIDNANIDQAKVNNLDTNYAHIENGVIDNATIDQAKVNNLDANYAHIQNGVIDNANIDQANINNLDANYAHITNGTIDNANISYANVSNLNAHYAHLEDGVIDNALIGYANVDQLDSHYAEIDMANVNNAWIENGVIKDAAISDAKILGVSANKLTAGKIDAANINVINLRADNLIVTKINGQPVIGGYTLVDPAISGYIDKNPSQEKWYEFYNNLYTLTVDTVVDPNKNYYTTSDSVELYDQATIDGMLENINARIDSQIETWTVDELPTLNNYPANQWNTNKLKDAHIGDICYVVNAADDYNGYTYRFAYDNKSQQYSWILIQDNDTAATLGRITQLEEFNNQLVHWEDATDEGVTTVRGRFTELSGRIDKVVKSSIQLWHTAENTTLPDKPTSAITSVSTEGNIWTSVVPIYNPNYPYYFYCWQYQYEDESYDWSAVVYDQATTEAQERARTGIANAATAQSTAEDNIRSNVQLWFTKKDKEEFPDKPTSQVTNNSATGNTSYNRWNLVVPTYNVGYPYYFYCYQQQKGDGTYQWTDVVYDDITSAAMETARSAISTFETFEQTTFKEVTDTIDTQGTTITQLQTATEKALSQGIEYIVGTHGTTATSNWTGVTQEEQLYTGKQIAYYMTSAGVSNNPATLTLKLSDDTWTDPIKVKINNTDVTDQYPKDTVIKLTYDGGAWKSDNYNSDTNYYDREAYKASVTANGAISAGRIGVFGTDGKLKLLSNSAFDTSYPILYIGTAYTTSALTQTNNYTFWGTPFNLTTTHVITGATAGKPVYIVGALNGNIMTPTSEVLTCTEPTEENGLFYLRLGLMSTASNAVLESQHPIYAFMDGKFQQTTQSVVTVSNTVNTVKQTADTNSAKISNLTQTLGTNADGTTAENDIIHQISEINQDLDGISTRVSKTEASLRSSAFATSSTATSTKAKTATIFPENNDFELYTGATITVKFTNNNTASAPTLKINSTEAKPIKTYSGANLSEAEYKWDAGSTMNFVYDGTNWRIQDSTELTRLKNNESRITQTADSITSLVANNETYTAPDGTTKTNTIRSAIKQNADNIDLRVEKANVIASINASVETDGTSAVKIAADKVNIEGAAIFNSGRLSTTSLNNTYDSKGSASAAQTAAINVAAEDATQKANDAQSAAEATAAADATKKANAARDAAISAAATDATTKANAAEANAKANAVKRTQRIWYRSNSATAPSTPGTASSNWVTKADDGNNAWTKMHIAINSTHKYIYTCEQYEMANGTVGYTSVLLDNTITVIDGGNIITGSVKANAINASSGTFDTANIPELTANHIKANVISSINQSTETVKIQASKVEIDGTAVFSAISSDVDDAITDKGYATTTQAQGYANTAKSEAISAAATDATSKANAAEANAKAAIPSDISELNNDTGFITNADVPTKVSELTNDSGFQTASQVNTTITGKGYQTASQVDSAITSKGYQTSSQVESAITSKGYATTTQAQEYANTAEQNAKAAIPTDISDLNNDSGFITSADVVQNWFATCTTAAGTKDKVATITPATTSFSLKAGVTVNIKFTNTNSYSATSSSHVTLNVNSTGAKNIYYGASSAPTGTNTTPFGRANYTNTYVYDGTYWVWVSSSADNNSDTYNRVRWQNVVTILEKPTGTWRILCGTASGYKQIKAGVTFDLAYPILSFSSQPEANTTDDTGYLSINSLTFSNTAAIQSGAAGKTIFLKGTISGNTFTIDSTNVFTTVVPTSEDGFFYIPLGIMTSATAGYFESSKDLYAYLDGRFRQVTPTEIVASQRIYYRSKVSGTVPKPTAWVTLATNKYNDTISVGNGGWSTKVTPIAASKAENVVKYLYLYTCEQRKRLDGTVECTAITLDENTTIIDGGNIITHTVTAEQLNATSINASKSLTVGAMTDDAASTILNSNVQVGGRNLLRLTQSPQVSATAWSYTAVPTSINGWTRYANAVTLERTDNGIKATHNTSTTSDGLVVPLVAYNAVTGGESLSVSFEYRTNMTSIGTPYLLATTNEGGTTGNTPLGRSVSIAKSETEWTKFSAIWTFPTATNKVYAFLLLTYLATSSGWIEIKDSTLKLERGNKATDWTPAPEDQTAYVDSIQIGGRNLLRGTAAMMSGTGRWNTGTFRASGGTLSNVTTTDLPLPSVSSTLRVTNNGSSAANVGFAQDVISGLVAGEAYTESGWIRASAAMEGYFQPIWKSTAQMTSTNNVAGKRFHLTTDWQWFSWTGTLNGDQASTYSGGYACAISCPAGGWFEVCGLKLEKGNKATDWTPAPEDVDSAIEQSVAGQGGFTILWNYEKFATANNGEGYICALDPTTGTKSDADGWVMWNGVKRTIPKGMINPNAVHPYNTPCYVVCRLSSADAATGTNYIVSYNSGWKGGVINAGALSDWTWNEATDIIIGKYVETASEAAFVEMEIYNPPLSSKQITTQNITASRANDTATTANNKLVAFRGVCSTAAGTAAKVVSCTGFALTQGYSITVYNTTDNTSAAKLTLNVNSLGAKDVWVAGAVTSDTNRLLWKAGSTITFVYDGTQFRVADSPASLYGTTCTIAEGTAAKTTTANDCVIFKGTQITVPMSNSNTATSPTLNVSSLGAANIYHGSGTTGPTKANGYAWPATAAVIFTYDGKFWRFGNQTFIDGGNILTGTIAADRIKANVISAVNNGTGTINADKINVSAIKIGDLNGASTVISNASNGNSALTKVNYYNRRCLVGQSASTNTNPWYKFASATITTQYVDKNIIFDVYNSGGYISSDIGTSMLGTLSAHFRAGANIQNCESPTLTWSNRGNDITLANFVLAYKVTAKSKIDCELWVKCDRAYAGYEFAVRYDDSRAAHTETAGWDLYNTWTAGSQAAITSGYTQVTSKDGDAARGVAEKYITSIDDNGIKVHAKNNPTKNYAQIDADGLDVIKNSISVAQFGKSDEYGPSTRIGQESKTHITIATSESEDTSGSSGYDHEKIAASEIKLYNTDGTKPNLKLYDSTIESYDDGENSNYYSYEVAGIDFGENGNKSVFGPTMDERSTGSTIRSVIGEDDTLLEILTGNTQSHRSAGTYIESARQWTSNTNYNDLAAIQTQVAEGGIIPSVYLHTISGLSSAALNVYANGSTGGVAIVADEVTLNDSYGHPTGCYITHGQVGQDTATNANSYRDVTIQFNHTYSSPPHVIATMYSTSTSPTMGSIQIAVTSVSNKEAKIRIFNNTSGGRSPGFHWLAIG